jgi:hypothetical protein
MTSTTTATTTTVHDQVKPGEDAKSNGHQSSTTRLDKTSTDQRPEYSTGSYKFPERDLFGPVTKTKAYRGFVIYTSMIVGGTAAWISSTSSTYRLLGAGLSESPPHYDLQDRMESRYGIIYTDHITNSVPWCRLSSIGRMVDLALSYCVVRKVYPTDAFSIPLLNAAGFVSSRSILLVLGRKPPATPYHLLRFSPARFVHWTSPTCILISLYHTLYFLDFGCLQH